MIYYFNYFCFFIILEQFNLSHEKNFYFYNIMGQFFSEEKNLFFKYLLFYEAKQNSSIKNI